MEVVEGIIYQPDYLAVIDPADQDFLLAGEIAGQTSVTTLDPIYYVTDAYEYAE